MLLSLFSEIHEGADAPHGSVSFFSTQLVCVRVRACLGGSSTRQLSDSKKELLDETI